MTARLDEILKKTTEHFTSRGISSARLDAELILSHALNLKRLDVYLKFDYLLKEEELVLSRELVMRRAKGEPVAYILGHREFYKSDFIVKPGVLVPRPDTELIVELAVSELSKRNLEVTEIWDLGVGTGCIGLSVLTDLPRARLIGFDLSEVAIEVAQANAEALTLGDRARFFKQDAGTISSEFVALELFDVLPDVILANPPYIGRSEVIQESVKKFEPAEALFSDDEGFAHFKAWAKVVAQFLKPGGFFAFEIGSKQASAVREFLGELNSFENVQVKKDLAGLDRAVCGFRRS